MIILQLIIEFFKTGLFSIGGGLAALPFLFDISNNYGWFTPGQLSEMIAISESTPGPIGVNMATYAGFMTAGILGGFVATLSMIIPSIIISIIVMKFLSQFKKSDNIESVFNGLRPAVAGLIAFAGYGIIKESLINIELFQKTNHLLDLINIQSILLFFTILIWSNKSKKHPVFFLGIGAIIGIVFKFQ